MATPDLDMMPARFLVVCHTVEMTDCTRQITFIPYRFCDFLACPTASSRRREIHTTFQVEKCLHACTHAISERERAIRDWASFWAWFRQLFPLAKLWRSLRAARLSIAPWPSAGGERREAEAMSKTTDDEKIRTVSVSWPVHPALDEIIQELEDTLELKPDPPGLLT